MIACLGFVGVWLLISMQLPHRDVPWRSLVPGAIIVAVGLELISIVVTYVIEPRLASSESAYGALGVAATLLFGLYLISRLVVSSAIVNAAIWDRHSASSRA